MADYYWIGNVNADASEYRNYKVGSYDGSTAIALPGASDTVHFGWYAEEDCEWDIATINRLEFDADEIDGGDIRRFASTFLLQSDVALNGLIIDGKLVTQGARTLTFSGTPPYDGRYVKNGDVGIADSVFDELTYIFEGGVFHMDAGVHPQVQFKTGTFRPQFITPYSPNNSTIDIYKLTVASTFSAIAPSGSFRNDRRVKIRITSVAANSLSCAINNFNLGMLP